MLDLHWNENVSSFAVIPLTASCLTQSEFEQSALESTPESNNANDDKGMHTASREAELDAGLDLTTSESTCNLTAVRTVNEPVNVRELLGFMPWYFDSLIPSERAPAFFAMWDQLFDDNCFQAPYGLRTAELRHECYNYSYDHGDCWNGPSWPFETARVLTGAANLLNRVDLDPASLPISVDDYWSLLTQYIRQHTATSAVNDTADPVGSGHIFENLHPDLGYWNNRARKYWENASNKDQGDDYNHSTLTDLILSGLLGIRPQENSTLLVNPLIPSSIQSFAADHVRVNHGRILSVVYDATGTVYRDAFEAGLTVLLDGQIVAHAEELAPLLVDLA